MREKSIEKQIPGDLITVAAAQKILGVSAVKMAKLVKEGVLRHWSDPLDGRVKLVSQREVEGLKSIRMKAA